MKGGPGEPYNMIDGISSKVGNLKLPMHYRGQEQIDAIWISKDLEATIATVLSSCFSIGNHQGILWIFWENKPYVTKLQKYKDNMYKDYQRTWKK